MDKVISAVILIVVGFSGVCCQTAQANTTINLIEDFKTSTVDTLSGPFNTLRAELDGGYFRILTALRLERSGYNNLASSFPYHQLTAETRAELKGNLTALVKCTDETAEYLQNEGMTSFFNFMSDARSPIEMALKSIDDQLNALEDSVRRVNDTSCLTKIDVNTRNLTATYLNTTTGINLCTTNASATYREPIRNYTTASAEMLFTVTPINVRLAFCNFPGNKEPCIKSFLAAYSGSACKSISKVGDQAKLMITTVQAEYKKCLSDVTTKYPLPEKSPYQNAVDGCVPTTLPPQSPTTPPPPQQPLDNGI